MKSYIFSLFLICMGGADCSNATSKAVSPLPFSFLIKELSWGFFVSSPAFILKSKNKKYLGGISMIQNSAVCLSKATQEKLKTYCQIQNKQQKEVVEMAIEMLLSGEKGDEYEKNKRK
jgi:hypothetical protein